MKVLGIETSCDETAVAIVDSERKILANILRSQVPQHCKFGGVVPEIAARSHIEFLSHLVDEAFLQAQVKPVDVDAIAVTSGPGLIGGLIVGVMLAKGLASAVGKPIIAVNHLEGHALTCRLVRNVNFPFLLLLMSGGHCQLLEVCGVGDYNLLGTTIDDAVGETFDKVAKMLNFGYPGGPVLEKAARGGNRKAFDLPLPLCVGDNLNFSFSGLKTAVKRIIDRHEITEEFISDISATFQETVAKILCYKLGRAVKLFKQKHPHAHSVVIAGGVAANKYIGEKLTSLLADYSMELIVPPLSLCTDNAAMIAWAGMEKLKLNEFSPIDFEPRSRWPLTELKNG
jgi:N6-L-threonylcarbamoyladenine synthase